MSISSKLMKKGLADQGKFGLGDKNKREWIIRVLGIKKDSVCQVSI